MTARLLAGCLSFLVSLGTYGGGGPPASAPGDLDEVMHLLALRRHGQASFIEQRFLSLLKRPAESSGELIYDAPDRLEKRTLEPRPESLLVDGNVLTVQRGHRSHVIDLSSSAQILPFVESIRATLAGDRAALERVFRLEFTGNLTRWTLVLFPLDARVAKSVSQVQIDGSRDNLLKVEIRQPDGDRSLMTLRARSDP
ncbi:MAG: outer membrane lipoprotein carrier protein LolA [Pseudomonadota bacterium]|nr:outer membrane lipoprotein carrier protein LolA [Pseudomonadota bacterium]